MSYRIVLAVLLLAAWGWWCEAAQGAPYTGLTVRVPVPTLAMPSELPAETPLTYATEIAFPAVAFINPIAIAVPPGETNRLFVVERAGRIVAITNLAVPTRTVFMDIGSRVSTAGEGGLLGLAFHPGFVSNGQFFVYYTASGTGFSNRVARFTTLAGNPGRGDTNSQVILFGQYDEASNHNGGTVAFGPDGYLYVSLGDEGGSNDGYNNASFIDKDLFSGILRLDVDQRPGSLPPNPHPANNGPVTNYAIPPDNPFIGATSHYGAAVNPAQVRTEFFAVGLRNAFRFSFDAVGGALYAADVGQNAWEEINLVTNGGHYGWAYREGFVSGPRSTSYPSTAFASPLLAYAHGSTTNRGYSVTGGLVYRGDRLPELVGHYVFADYVSGHIWAMQHNGVTNTAFRWLATDSEISGFGADPRNGDVLLCDLVASQVKRLVRGSGATSALPQVLSAAGVFHDTASLTSHEGVVPYELNLPFWSDGAAKRRWFALPDTTSVIRFEPSSAWTFPTGMVWIKHFDLLMTNGEPASARRIETRLLVKNGSGAGGYGVTYRWGSSQTDAALVPAAGLDEDLLLADGGTIRTQRWRYPSRQECLSCHQSASFALGFDTLQLNRDAQYAPDDLTNQLRRLSTAGYLHTNVASTFALLALAHLTNTEASVEYRARSWLQANCANCHFPGGPVPAAFDARFTTPLHSAGILEGALANDFGDIHQRVARPGVLSNSMLYTRANVRGVIQMPPLASSVVDTQGVAMLAAWISGSMTNARSYADWQAAFFGSTNADGSLPGDDPDLDGTPNQLEHATGRDPTNDASAWSLGEWTLGGTPVVTFEAVANRGFLVEVTTNLLEGDWSVVDAPENRPLFRAEDTAVTVSDPTATNEAARAYRVRVLMP